MSSVRQEAVPWSRPLKILLVEDSEADIRLTREALAEVGMDTELSVATDGEEAWQGLESGRHGVPDLILLDLNLPRVDGRDVLRRLKTHERWRRIPLVVLTTSTAEEDVQAAYGLHANCYVNKPLHFEQFVEVMTSITDFWLRTVRRADVAGEDRS